MTDLLLLLAALSVFDAPIDCNNCENWNRPQDPFHVYGNTWYVGTGGLGAVLIETDSGLVLLDGGLPQSAEPIVNSIRELGFEPEDISIIGMSHAHYDHVGGLAALQRISGATVYASPDASKALTSGALQENDPQYGGGMAGQTYAAIDNVVVADDGMVLDPQGARLTLIYTPGHTWGGTSWTWESCEDDRCLDVAYIDSLMPVSRPGYRYSDGLDEVLRETLDRVANLDCDIMLSTHDVSFGLHEKLAAGRSAFIEPGACRELASKTTTYLEKRLKSEQP